MEGSVGEAWILSDRNDFASVVADGTLAGKTLPELREKYGAALLGDLTDRFERFPLLLKFLDAREQLSVQVHPSDHMKDLLPPGENGKTEAWVVLESKPESLIYSGLKEGVSREDLAEAIAKGAVKNLLATFEPMVGDGLFIPSGTVHALGGDLVVFEVQENSDMTFRLYDWDRVDAKTGKPRDLQINQAMACIDFGRGPVAPVRPVREHDAEGTMERLFDCEHFIVWRHKGARNRYVGKAGAPRVVVCIEGSGLLQLDDEEFKVVAGDVYLLPANTEPCCFSPIGSATVLEIGVPEASV